MNVRIYYNLLSKDYREGNSAVKKTLSDLALPLHVADEFLEKYIHTTHALSPKVCGMYICI
jgi:hypothetical protein